MLMCACVHRRTLRKNDKREERMSKKGPCQHFLLKWHRSLYNTVSILQYLFYFNYFFFKKWSFLVLHSNPCLHSLPSSCSLHPPPQPHPLLILFLCKYLPVRALHSTLTSWEQVPMLACMRPHAYAHACGWAQPAWVPSGLTSVETGSVQNATFLFINN